MNGARSLFGVDKKAPGDKIEPIITNGTPQSAKNNGALPIESTEYSQNIAKPPQRRLNGMKKASDERRKTPCLGRPHARGEAPSRGTCCELALLLDSAQRFDNFLSLPFALGGQANRSVGAICLLINVAGFVQVAQQHRQWRAALNILCFKKGLEIVVRNR